MEDGWLDTPFDLSGKRVWVAGHRGMVGGALCRRLQSEDCEVVTSDFDLREQAAVHGWMGENKPDVVVIAAAKVGGILANDTYPADFLYDNLMIEANIIHAAHEAGVEKLLFLGSSCIYPKEAAQPLLEDALLGGALEPTNEAYAIAKIAGIKLCEAYRKQYGRDFISAMPCNLYGPGDRFDEEGSHVIPALIMKAHGAKERGAEALVVWGSGKPLREFLYVDDLAEALVFMLKRYSGVQHVNIGAGEDISISDLAVMIAGVVGFEGGIVFDTNKPDGMFRKLMDSGRIRKAGWEPKTGLEEGLALSYGAFLRGMAVK
ncbi:MAG: GDP-L-fucose synthase [Alphaproteobacteria bacterium]